MYEKFDKFITKVLNSIVVTILIFVIGIVITGTFLYNKIDFTYATEKDYEPLYEVHQSIIDDFDNVYTFSNTDIDITDSNIIVDIHGDNCYLKTYFNKTMSYQRAEKIDTTNPRWFSIFLLAFGTFIGAICFYLLYLLIFFAIDALLVKIINYKNIKNRKH